MAAMQNEVRISRRSFFSISGKKTLVNGIGRDLEINASNKECSIIENKTTTIARIYAFDNIEVLGKYFGKIKRPFQIFSSKKPLYVLNRESDSYSLSDCRTLNFLGEHSCKLLYNGKTIAELKFMQNIVFCGGEVVLNIIDQSQSDIAIVFSVFLWMDKNFYLDKTPTGT